MPKWLAKEYGPFSGVVWVVVIVGGVGLGLVTRRYFAGRGGAVEATGAVAPVEDAALSPAFVGGGTLYNQGEIVAEVLEAIKTQEPPPATTNPVVVTGPAGPRGPAGPAAPAPKPPASTVPTYPELRPAILATGHTNIGAVVNISDVRIALKRIGHDPGAVLNPGDIDVLKRWYARKVG